jgi:hypothetical protein
LRSFEQLCSSRSYSNPSPDEFRARLFPFSLVKKAKMWSPSKRRKSSWIGGICTTNFVLNTFPYFLS